MSIITKTIKLKLLPNEEQVKALNEIRQAYINACNFVSEYAFNNKTYNRITLQKILYKDVRNIYNLPAQKTCSVFRTVIVSYKTLRTSIKNYKGPKKKGPKWKQINFSKGQCDLVRTRDYSFKKDNILSVNTLDGRIKVKYISKHFERYFDTTKYQFGTAKLLYKNNNWYLCVPVTFETIENTKYTNIVGIDLGINFTAVSYDSSGKTKFYSGKQIKNTRAKYKELRRQLQKTGTPSSRRRLKAIGQRENRWMQDINHCISKALVTSQPEGTLFVLEDLTDIRSATEKIKRKNRYETVSWSFYDLRQKIAYKAMEHGGNILLIDPAYTSQRCPVCGTIEKASRNKKLHLYHCKHCGYSSNDDRIGAMNIYYKGVTAMTIASV